MTDRSPYSGAEIVGEIGEIDLFTSDDEKVGRILEVNPQFIVVERGGFLSGKSEYFIPREYVVSESGDRWMLSVGRGELDTIGSSERPDLQSEPGSMGTEASTMDTDSGDASRSEGETQTVQVHEEELEAQKVTREAGEVSITKDVVEETRTIEVPVMREEVRVERRLASDTSTSDHPDAFTGDSITIPVMEEEVEVRKVAKAVEEIEISKVQSQDTETVSDTVRKERVNIDDSSDTTSGRA